MGDPVVRHEFLYLSPAEARRLLDESDDCARPVIYDGRRIFIQDVDISIHTGWVTMRIVADEAAVVTP